MPRRGKRSKLIGKAHTKHSDTIMDNVGAGSVPHSFVIMDTGGGPRSTTGTPQTIQSAASTAEECRTGDTIKYINLHLQAAPRSGHPETEKMGWMEWAMVLVRENENTVPTTRIGIQTLGDICTQMYRGECIYSGVIPVGGAQPSVSEIQLKIPKNKTRIKLGDEWRFMSAFRATLTTAVATDAVRLVKSFNYICYS